MSALESENIPLIGSVMQDLATPFDADQQNSLSVWALKTAMVLDSVNAKERGRFYSEDECRSLREKRTIPEQTYVWIGAYVREGYSADGTILSLDFPGKPKGAKASVSTFVVGHLAIQVFTIHPEPQHKDLRVDHIQMRVGEWDKLLVRVWPIETKPVSWPPPLTFTNSGKYSNASLFARWRIGKNATSD
jgi:hypothetical protein